MKTILLLLFLVCFCGVLCQAQSGDTWVVDRYFTSADVSSHLQKANVKSGDSDIHKLLHGDYSATFSKASIELFSPRKTDTAYWLRVSVVNQTAGDLWLFSPYQGFFEYNVYLVNNDSVVCSYQDGSLQPFSKREIPLNVSLFPLTIPAGTEQQVYIYIRHTYAPTGSFYLATPATFTGYLHLFDLISGAYLGLFLLILFYNIIIYYYLRDQSNLIYSLWITADVLATFCYHGLAFEFLWPQLPSLNKYIDVFSSAAILLQIVLNFSLFRLRTSSRLFTRTSYVVAFFALLCILSQLFGLESGAYPFSDAGAVIVLNGINTLALSIVMVWRGVNYALYYLLGNLLLFISMMVVILSAYAIIDLKVVSQMTLIYFGSAGEILFFALALALRVRTIKTEQEKSERENLQLLEEREQMVQKQNLLLEKKVAERTAALSQSLKELRETQAQLIQREKMASLGELTAGIAHEIQNPLNFVNNFSEVNGELLEEVKEEMKASNTDFAIEITNDIVQNNQKISHHGKRASAIIRNMLEHSRTTGEGKKEMTNINALVNEYVQLAYHGVRAKHPSFSAAILTDFDAGIGDILIAPGEISRALLNIYNNAFYAVMQKKNTGSDGYKPTVSVSTKQADGNIAICIRDNGTGIPTDLLGKIFHPFFTTKPTGEGTGLGLSLCHDIITQGHNGELKVNSVTEQYTEFIIYLPAVSSVSA